MYIYLGVFLPGGVCLSTGSVCLGGVCNRACNEVDTPLWTEFLTHACENVTFPQLLLRTVTICFPCKLLHNFKSRKIPCMIQVGHG